MAKDWIKFRDDILAAAQEAREEDDGGAFGAVRAAMVRSSTDYVVDGLRLLEEIGDEKEGDFQEAVTALASVTGSIVSNWAKAFAPEEERRVAVRAFLELVRRYADGEGVTLVTHIQIDEKAN